jgi:membrane-bound ClpP family serine protease
MVVPDLGRRLGAHVFRHNPYIILILVLLGVIPTWGHSRAWGYGPSGIVGFILIIVIILALLGRL